MALEFSPFPAARFREDGKFNGTRFREEHLIPALNENEDVEVSLDGVAGVASSFLEEAFGGLLRHSKFEPEYLQKHLQISTTEKDLKDFQELAKRYLDPEWTTSQFGHT